MIVRNKRIWMLELFDIAELDSTYKQSRKVQALVSHKIKSNQTFEEIRFNHIEYNIGGRIWILHVVKRAKSTILGKFCNMSHGPTNNERTFRTARGDDGGDGGDGRGWGL